MNSTRMTNSMRMRRMRGLESLVSSRLADSIGEVDEVVVVSLVVGVGVGFGGVEEKG